MISSTEALERILAETAPLGSESTPLPDALGRYAASSKFATLALPAFDQSAMDGYAIHVADCAASHPLEVIGECAAGDAPHGSVSPGKCMRIFTGAPVPAGTGAVVMQEDVERTGDLIRLSTTAEPGEFIRRRGADLCEGQRLWESGEMLTPARLAVLASQGQANVDVYRRARIAIVTTGNELRAPGQPLLHQGQIYNSNAILLHGLIESFGLAAGLHRYHIADNLAATQRQLGQLLETYEVVVIAGGVSVGEHDLVKPALEALGVTTQFWRVNMKPGKPFLYGKSARSIVFGLPGNPVSVLVTAFLFVIPALRRLSGALSVRHSSTRAILEKDVINSASRETFVRGHFDATTGRFRPQGLQESHAIFSASQANALLPVPPHGSVAAGDSIAILSLHPTP